jgi:hypothetical protein
MGVAVSYERGPPVATRNEAGPSYTAAFSRCRGTSLNRKGTPLEPYRTDMPRALR